MGTVSGRLCLPVAKAQMGAGGLLAGLGWGGVVALSGPARGAGLGSECTCVCSFNTFMPTGVIFPFLCRPVTAFWPAYAVTSSRLAFVLSGGPAP